MTISCTIGPKVLVPGWLGRYELMTNREAKLHVMAVDCCEHVLAALGSVPFSQVSAVASGNKKTIEENYHDIDIIVIGVPRYPVRRLFISGLRRIYPNLPMLVLRRDDINGNQEGRESIRGEFILSDRGRSTDFEIVRSLRQVFPLAFCAHSTKGNNYDTVREVVRVIAENYADPDLDLNRVARQVPISPARLSRILNQHVGVSFRQLLRHTRIEEAKRMLASSRYSIKEVAVRVGFTDNHYFSRSFKELTGHNASDYKAQEALFT